MKVSLSKCTLPLGYVLASATTFEGAILEESASDSELRQILPARTPKRTRRRPKESSNARVERMYFNKDNSSSMQLWHSLMDFPLTSLVF